jgi:hypothetical protein
VLLGSVVALALSMVGGLIVGGYFYSCALATENPHQIYKYMVASFAFSWVLIGASLFSFLISLRAKRLKLGKRGWHCCGSALVIAFGIQELSFVLAGFLSGLIIDSAQLQEIQYYNNGYYYGFFPATLVIGLPLIYIGLGLGVVRVAATYYQLFKEPKRDDLPAPPPGYRYERIEQGNFEERQSLMRNDHNDYPPPPQRQVPMQQMGQNSVSSGQQVYAPVPQYTVPVTPGNARVRFLYFFNFFLFFLFLF